jgi:hypothetical protein
MDDSLGGGGLPGGKGDFVHATYQSENFPAGNRP